MFNEVKTSVACRQEMNMLKEPCVKSKSKLSESMKKNTLTGRNRASASVLFA